MKTTAPITIFEGPDCSGKTTAAKAYAKMTGALYVHAGPRIGMGARELLRTHMESMMPALLGLRPVVLDRFHKSEEVYGPVCRWGSRLDRDALALLDRAALRCGAVQVNCATSWSNTEGIFCARIGQEMLKDTSTLLDVYSRYLTPTLFTHNLPELNYNFVTEPHGVDHSKIQALRTPLHAVASKTAGNLSARNVLVYSSTEAPDDSLLHSIGSLQYNHSTIVAASQMRKLGLTNTEYETLWVDTDDLAENETLVVDGTTRIFHFGSKAYAVLHSLKLESIPL